MDVREPTRSLPVGGREFPRQALRTWDTVAATRQADELGDNRMVKARSAGHPYGPIRWLGVCALAVALAACTSNSGESAAPSAASAPPPAEGFVQVRPSGDPAEPPTDIAYRDYGGEGSPIVLLTGLGDTAGVFDQLGPLLRDQGHRVVALTRRGYGASSKSGTGYDLATRTQDDAAAISALGLDRPVVVGHSIAGDELIGLATEYPERVAGVVSLDAMLDRSPGGEAAAAQKCGGAIIGSGPAPAVDPMDPYGSMQAFYEELYGFPLGNGTANVRALWALNGTDLDSTADPEAVPRILAAASKRPPAFSGMRVPVLAIFALSTVDSAFPWLKDEDPSSRQYQRATRCNERSVALRNASAEQLARQQPQASIQKWDATNHYLYLQWPERTATAIGEWIDSEVR